MATGPNVKTCLHEFVLESKANGFKIDRCFVNKYSLLFRNSVEQEQESEPMDEES